MKEAMSLKRARDEYLAQGRPLAFRNLAAFTGNGSFSGGVRGVGSQKKLLPQAFFILPVIEWTALQADEQ